MALLKVYGILAWVAPARRPSSRNTSIPEKCRLSESRLSRACSACARSVKVSRRSSSTSIRIVSEKLPIASKIRGWMGGRLASVLFRVNLSPAPHRASVSA